MDSYLVGPEVCAEVLGALLGNVDGRIRSFSHHALSLVLRSREVLGVLCTDPARPEDGI